MNLIQSYITKNRTYTAPTVINVRGLMIHSVGTPQPKASVFINNWNSSTISVSVHGIIEAGGNAYQLLPWNYKAWHCGGTGNSTHIGVEMTEPSTITYTSGANFTDSNPAATEAFVRDTYATAVELFAKLCKAYSLNPLADGVIVSHADGYRRGIASNHADPEHLWNRFGLTMAGFRTDISAKMSESGGEAGETVTATIYRVTTQTSGLNCRTAPGTAAAVLGSFPKDGLVTATRRSGDWIYVTDGSLSGWSSAAYLSDAAALAAETLTAKGVIDTPEYWVEHYRDLQYLDQLLIKLAALTYTGGAPMADVDAAIGVLNLAGAINTPDYWRENYVQVKYLDLLLLKAAGAI